MIWVQAVDWNGFSWEAFATLATGVTAVVAATVIGLRQTDISAKQTKILDLQNKLAKESADRDYHILRQRFRLDLLDRRLELVQEFKRLWVQWSMQGNLDESQWRDLHKVFESAQLLYPDDISADLNIALDNLMKERISEKRNVDYGRRGDGARAKKYLEDSFKYNDDAREVMSNMLDRIVQETKVLLNATSV